MFRLSTSIFILFLVSSTASANLKSCGLAMEVARTGTLTLTQEEATDLRGLPGVSLAQVVKSLKGYWIQISTREVFPTFANKKERRNVLLKVLDTGERFRFGRSMMVVVGALSESGSSLVTTEVFLSDITSVKLVDVPEITISLSTSQKLVRAPRLDERILTLAENDTEATVILSRLAEAQYPRIYDKEGSFESFLNLLDSQQISGRQLVVAYRDYAKENIRELILGVINNPREVAQVIVKGVGLNFKPDTRLFIQRSN